ncbi:MAG TPA: CPBP family intramembrane glutamic endopeptidase [Acidobacteriaceae bacterium]|nr:CPBP family intramembrane glutamic endopeptidase [Acidobacteriaceae bacterium]
MRPSPRAPHVFALDLLELAVGYGLILIVIWTPNPAQRILYWTAFAWIAITAILRRKQIDSHGLGLRGLLPSLWIVAVAAVLCLAAIALAGHLHTLHRLYGPLPILTHLWGYALWALMQQFILQIYVLTRFLRLGLRPPAAIALSAILFALAHIPNPVLLVVTPLWGAISCWLFLRYRNLYPLALAHGILGMTLAVTIPNSINRHMRVGLGYVEYPTHAPHP